VVKTPIGNRQSRIVVVGPRSLPFFRPRQSSPAQAVINATHGEPEVQTEAMDFDRLGEEMADRLNAVAPLGIHIRYQADGKLCYTYEFEGAYGNSSAGEHFRNNLGLRPGEPIEAWAREVCEAALDHFQDFVNEMTATPWPGEQTVPSAHAELIGSEIVLFYGDPEAPTLRCGVIELT
jgi:hypothetical protein